MAIFLPRRNWLTKYLTNRIAPTNLIAASTSPSSRSSTIRFFAKSTSVLMNDSGRGRDGLNRPKSSKSIDDPCQTKCDATENICDSLSIPIAKNSPATNSKNSENALKKCSQVSRPGSCVADSSQGRRRPSGDSSPLSVHPETNCRISEKCGVVQDASRADDPCARDCKLSPAPECCEDTSTLGPCPQPPPGLCPPNEDAEKRMRFWRQLTLFGALPIVLIASIIIRIRVEEESTKPRPEYVPWDYMYRRTKRFPWGDGNHTFFHNPEKNPVPPNGYEVEDPNAVVTK